MFKLTVYLHLGLVTHRVTDAIVKAGGASHFVKVEGAGKRGSALVFTFKTGGGVENARARVRGVVPLGVGLGFKVETPSASYQTRLHRPRNSK